MQVYNVLVVGCTDPELHGPYKSYWERFRAARKIWREANQQTDCLFKLNIDNAGKPSVSPYVGDELESK